MDLFSTIKMNMVIIWNTNYKSLTWSYIMNQVLPTSMSQSSSWRLHLERDPRATRYWHSLSYPTFWSSMLVLGMQELTLPETLLPPPELIDWPPELRLVTPGLCPFSVTSRKTLSSRAMSPLPSIVLLPSHHRPSFLAPPNWNSNTDCWPHPVSSSNFYAVLLTIAPRITRSTSMHCHRKPPLWLTRLPSSDSDSANDFHVLFWSSNAFGLLESQTMFFLASSLKS